MDNFLPSTSVGKSMFGTKEPSGNAMLIIEIHFTTSTEKARSYFSDLYRIVHGIFMKYYISLQFQN